MAIQVNELKARNLDVSEQLGLVAEWYRSFERKNWRLATYLNMLICRDGVDPQDALAFIDEQLAGRDFYIPTDGRYSYRLTFEGTRCFFYYIENDSGSSAWTNIDSCSGLEVSEILDQFLNDQENGLGSIVPQVSASYNEARCMTALIQNMLNGSYDVSSAIAILGSGPVSDGFAAIAGMIINDVRNGDPRSLLRIVQDHMSLIKGVTVRENGSVSSLSQADFDYALKDFVVSAWEIASTVTSFVSVLASIINPIFGAVFYGVSSLISRGISYFRENVASTEPIYRDDVCNCLFNVPVLFAQDVSLNDDSVADGVDLYWTIAAVERVQNGASQTPRLRQNAFTQGPGSANLDNGLIGDHYFCSATLEWIAQQVADYGIFTLTKGNLRVIITQGSKWSLSPSMRPVNNAVNICIYLRITASDYPMMAYQTNGSVWKAVPVRSVTDIVAAADYTYGYPWNTYAASQLKPDQRTPSLALLQNTKRNAMIQCLNLFSDPDIDNDGFDAGWSDTTWDSWEGCLKPDNWCLSSDPAKQADQLHGSVFYRDILNSWFKRSGPDAGAMTFENPDAEYANGMRVQFMVQPVRINPDGTLNVAGTWNSGNSDTWSVRGLRLLLCSMTLGLTRPRNLPNMKGKIGKLYVQYNIPDDWYFKRNITLVPSPDFGSYATWIYGGTVLPSIACATPLSEEFMFTAPNYSRASLVALVAITTTVFAIVAASVVATKLLVKRYSTRLLAKKNAQLFRAQQVYADYPTAANLDTLTKLTLSASRWNSWIGGFAAIPTTSSVRVAEAKDNAIISGINQIVQTQRIETNLKPIMLL